ncbi:CRAL/TRIO domain containing protein [Nitzschia inconspicua]|uniref:CRAL/TRIO domain containing protein n=1 Tax=Nitzschia inconspicua TaxID=303405 RepID=A0A9K3LRA6_9STRA|nr:CRAL/TRIO domain containing protein [Nitzschia inconspicua]
MTTSHTTIARWTQFAVLLFFASLMQYTRCQPGVGHRFLSSYTFPEGILQGLQDQEQNESLTSVDKEYQVGSTTYSSQNQQQPQSQDLFGVFEQLGTSWYAILQTIRNIVRSSGGMTYTDDVFANDIDTALSMFRDMIPEAWTHLSSSVKTTKLSDVLPLDEFGKSLDDLYISFLRWSLADSAVDQLEETATCKLHGGANAGKSKLINVSKAFRRIERYMEWMEEAYEDLVSPDKLTSASLVDIWSAFQMKMTYDDCGRLVWWLDLALVDLPRIQSEIPPREITRLFVWIAHYIMFNPQAQNNGIVFFSGMGHIDFWTFMTMLPVDVGLKLDSFTISVIPAKTKFLVLYDRPSWAKILFQLVKPFLRRAMQRRVIVIEEGLYERDVVKDVIGTGTQAIPTGLGHFWLNGSDDADFLGPLFDPNVSSRKRQKMLQKQLKAS